MKLLEKVAEKVAERCGMTLAEAKDCGLSVRKDSNDWAYSDDGFVGFIMWEEGPFEWPTFFSEYFYADPACKDIAGEVHTICGWGLIGVIEAN